MIPHIQLGNDFSVTLTVKRSDGTPEDLSGVSDMDVSLILNGASWVIVVPRRYYYSSDGIISADVSADAVTHPGMYRAVCRYVKDGRRYLADNCKAFVMTDGCYTTGVTESIGVTLDVQFSADGRDGLSAYELAVANGEYTGPYSGYQQWLASGARPNEWVQLSVNIERSLSPDGEYYNSDGTLNQLVFRGVGYVQDVQACDIRLLRCLKRGNKSGRFINNGWGVMRRGDGENSKIVYSQPLDTLERTVCKKKAADFVFNLSDDPGSTLIRSGYAKSSIRFEYNTEFYRIDISNMGFAVFHGKLMISNIVPVGITVINEKYRIDDDLYIETKAYYTLGVGARNNIRKLIKFPVT